MDEIRFYHPDVIAKFLRDTSDTVVGAFLVTKIPRKSNLQKYLVRRWYYLRFNDPFALQQVQQVRQ